MSRSSLNFNKKTFSAHVIAVVRLIPYGKVSTYGAIANCLGVKRSARMVGHVLSKTTGLIDFPAHRVVNRAGYLTGKHHFSSSNEMENRLIAEGVKIKNDKIIDFEAVFWDPLIQIEP